MLFFLVSPAVGRSGLYRAYMLASVVASVGGLVFLLSTALSHDNTADLNNKGIAKHLI